MANWSGGEMIAEAWDMATEPIMTGILYCRKCEKHSVFSWAIVDEEAWKQKYFCPHCQSKFFPKVNRGTKKTKSHWTVANPTILIDEGEETAEKWKTAEKLMGQATLLKKEELLDKILTQHIQYTNALKDKAKAAKYSPKSDIAEIEDSLLLKNLLSKVTRSA